MCWIGTQEPNVYGGLAVAMPFIHTRPKYFGQVVGELLYWLGEDRLTFASDYALWHPKWLVEMFVDYQYPDEYTEYPELTANVKKKILGLNAARLYDLKVPEGVTAADEGTGPDVTEKPAIPQEATIGGHSE
jgi:predicted TIM-barrel fold metal-dependent hydrolase